MERAPAAGAGEASGDVEEAVAEPFRFRERVFALEHEQEETVALLRVAGGRE